MQAYSRSSPPPPHLKDRCLSIPGIQLSAAMLSPLSDSIPHMRGGADTWITNRQADRQEKEKKAWSSGEIVRTSDNVVFKCRFHVP